MKRSVWRDLQPAVAMLLVIPLAALAILVLMETGIITTRPALDCEPGFAYARLLDSSERCVILPDPTAGGM